MVVIPGVSPGGGLGGDIEAIYQRELAGPAGLVEQLTSRVDGLCRELDPVGAAFFVGGTTRPPAGGGAQPGIIHIGDVPATRPGDEDDLSGRHTSIYCVSSGPEECGGFESSAADSLVPLLRDNIDVFRDALSDLAAAFIERYAGRIRCWHGPRTAACGNSQAAASELVEA